MPTVRLVSYLMSRRLAFSVDLFPGFTTQWHSDLDEKTTLVSIVDSLQIATADIQARRRYVTTPSISRCDRRWEIIGDTVMILYNFRTSREMPYNLPLYLPAERILGILDDLTNMVEFIIQAPDDAIECFDANGGGFAESSVPPMMIVEPGIGDAEGKAEDRESDPGDLEGKGDSEDKGKGDDDAEGGSGSDSDSDSGSDSGSDSDSEVKAENDVAVVRMPEEVHAGTLAAVKFTKPGADGSPCWSVVWDNHGDDWSLTFVATTMQDEIVRFMMRQANCHSLDAWRAVLDSDGKVYSRRLHHSASIGARGGQLIFKSTGMGVNRRVAVYLADVAPVLEQAIAFGASSKILTNKS